MMKTTSTVGEERKATPVTDRRIAPRMAPGGDLYTRPMTVEEMAAPLAWHEAQMAIVWRYGVLSDGSIGHRRVK